MRNERNWGIDLLRIVSMLMVVMLHVLRQGGVLFSTQVLTPRYEVVWLLEVMGFCAVNCYALVSGYVGVEAKFKYANIIALWLQVAWYTLLITGAFAILYPGIVGIKEMKSAFSPVLSKQYWYFTAYFCVFFFVPVLNYLIKTLAEKELKKLIVTLVILFSILPTVCNADIFGTSKGYSPLWLGILYLIGGYMKKYDVMEKTPRYKYLLMYSGSVLITWFYKIIIDILNKFVLSEPWDGNALLCYTSPTILLAGVSLVLFFSKMQVLKLKKVVSWLAPLAFSVYLIHTHPLVWEYVMKEQFSEYVTLPITGMLAAILLTVVGIYVVCSCIDAIRVQLFKIFGVKKRCEAIEMKISNYINRR